jgi:NAD(P)-dependent dehydrogenase (short-subunit alcohol dehydrogenase family)
VSAEAGPAARRVLVTGAGRGIGREAAMRLAAGGARVLGVSRTAAELETLADDAGVEVLSASLADGAGCRAVAAEAIERLGGVDVLVHAAGVDTHREKPIWLQDETVWRETMAVNADAAFELARLLTGPMTERGWGRIVFVSSTAGVTGGAACSAYVAAKHAVIGIMRAAAIDTAPFGVTVNAVLPGWVRGTGMSDRTIELTSEREGISAEEAWRRIEATTPAGRVATPVDVAAMVAFLVSDDAAAITGEAVRVAYGSVW